MPELACPIQAAMSTERRGLIFRAKMQMAMPCAGLAGWRFSCAAGNCAACPVLQYSGSAAIPAAGQSGDPDASVARHYLL